MQFGICTSPANGDILAEAGYDFIEANVQRNLTESADAFNAFAQQVRQSPVPVKVANGFVPGRLKITGPEVDMRALHDYVALACSRAAEVGIEVIVFGSGGARQVPDGFDGDEAWQQLVAFTHTVAGEAEENGVTVVVEPLRKAECNIITSVGEGARLVREVNHPNIRLLADSFHWCQDNDSAEELTENCGILHHVHIATGRNRMPPAAEEFDFSEFFFALGKGGYEGRISIECRWDDLAAQCGAALAELRRYAASRQE